MVAKQLNDDDFDENGLLRDGRTLRVGMLMRDSLSPVQLAIADSHTLHDGLGNAAGNKPGYVFAADASARATLRDAYDQYDQDAANAWCTPGSLPEVKHDNSRPMTLDEVYAQRELEDQIAWRGDR